MLDCQKNPAESEEIFRFDDDEDDFLQSHHPIGSDFSRCSPNPVTNGRQDPNGNQVRFTNFNFDPSFDDEEILSIIPQKNFTFDIISKEEPRKPRQPINRTSRCFDLSSMYQSLSVGSSEEEDEFEQYDYSVSFEDMTIEGLRIHLRSCFTCGVHWHEEQASLDCTECGGYALSRPCPNCDGQCHATWNRNLDQSHSLGKARWTGTCRSILSSN